MKALRSDMNIVILPADKGNSTVVMNRKEYDEKITQIISDSTKFEKVRKSSPVSRIEKEAKALVKKVGMEKEIIIPEGCKVPHIYGLPKIHKPDVPLRPVVSCIASTLHPLAKYLLRILNPLQLTIESGIKNSADFISKIEQLEVQPHTKMVSFDVVNLFTSVPIGEALAVLRRRLEEDGSLNERTSMTIDQIVELTEYCVRNTYFQYKDEYFKQVDGMAMGSPLSPVLCNLFMSDLEKTAMEKSQQKPKIWLRYVDDTFALWEYGEDSLNGFLGYLNGINKAIKFTMEQENEGRLAFLDTLVKREDRKLVASVYRKPTHTDSYLRWNSNHPNSTKIGIVRCLAKRARTVCMKENDLRTELQHLQQAFLANGYPRKVLQKAMCKKNEKQELDTDTGPVATAVVPYLRSVHEKLRRICSKYNVRLAARSAATLRTHLTAVAPLQQPENRKGAVYQVSMSCGRVYIGETGRPLKKRMSEHKTACKYLKGEANAIAEHCINCSCAPQWDGVRCLGYEQNQLKRKIRESIEIKLAGIKIFAERSYDLSDA